MARRPAHRLRYILCNRPMLLRSRRARSLSRWWSCMREGRLLARGISGLIEPGSTEVRAEHQVVELLAQPRDALHSPHLLCTGGIRVPCVTRAAPVCGSHGPIWLHRALAGDVLADAGLTRGGCAGNGSEGQAWLRWRPREMTRIFSVASSRFCELEGCHGQHQLGRLTIQPSGG